MVEVAMPMVAFGPPVIGPGVITGGSCDFSCSLSTGVMNRLGKEDGLKAESLNLATAKSELGDIDPIGIYRLVARESTFRNKATGQIVTEKTLISPDFNNESIGVWTDAGEHGTGSTEEYQAILARARQLSNTDGTATMFWISPSKSDRTDGLPEHRAYLWEKNAEGEVTGFSYQFTGSTDTLTKTLFNLSHDASLVDTQALLWRGNQDRISHQRIFDAYESSLTRREKEQAYDFLNRFQEGANQSDNVRWERVELYKQHYEHKLREAYKGDIESALASVASGFLALARKSEQSTLTRYSSNDVANLEVVPTQRHTEAVVTYDLPEEQTQILAAFQREKEEEEDEDEKLKRLRLRKVQNRKVVDEEEKKNRTKKETQITDPTPAKVVEGSVAKNLKQENREDTVGVDTTITALIPLVKQIASSSQTNSQLVEIPSSFRDTQIDGSIEHDDLVEIIAPVVPVWIYQIEDVISTTQTFEESDNSNQYSISQIEETAIHEKLEEQTISLLVGLTLLQLGDETFDVNTAREDVATSIIIEKPDELISFENETKKIVIPAIIYLISSIEPEEETKEDFVTVSIEGESSNSPGEISQQTEESIAYAVNLFSALSEIEEAIDQQESEITQEDRILVKEIQEASLVIVPAFLALSDQLSTANLEYSEEHIVNPFGNGELLDSSIEDRHILDSKEFSAIWQEVFELMIEEEVSAESNKDGKIETVNESNHLSENKIQRLEIITEQVQQAIDLIINFSIDNFSSQLISENHERDSQLPEVFEETVQLGNKILEVVAQAPQDGLPSSDSSLAKLFILTKLFKKEEISQDERKLLIALMYQQIRQIYTDKKDRDLLESISQEIIQLVARSQPLEQKLEEVEVRLDSFIESEGIELSASVWQQDLDLLDKLIFLVNIKKNSDEVFEQIKDLSSQSDSELTNGHPDVTLGSHWIPKPFDRTQGKQVRNDFKMSGQNATQSKSTELVHSDEKKIDNIYEQVMHITNSFSDEERLGTIEIIVLRQKVLNLLLREAQQNGIDQKELIIANDWLEKDPDYMLILIPKLLIALDYQDQQIWKILKLLQIQIDNLGNKPKIDKKRSRNTQIEQEGMLFERNMLHRKRLGKVNKKAKKNTNFGVIYQYRPLVMEAAFVTQ